MQIGKVVSVNTCNLPILGIMFFSKKEKKLATTKIANVKLSVII
jgi:hypothetical protein